MVDVDPAAVKGTVIVWPAGFVRNANLAVPTRVLIQPKTQ
jgi:hypothetical protein